MTGSPGWRAALLAAGAMVGWISWLAARRATAGRPRWTRTNFRGRHVTLGGGLAAALALAISSVVLLALASTVGDDGPDVRRVAAATLVVVVSAGTVGLYDDLYGDAATKGFRGHLRALRRGRVSSGLAKLAVICLAAVAAAAVLGGGEVGVQQVIDAGVIAGCANLANLLDLRPGRALKVLVGVAVPTACLAGPAVGAVVAVVAGTAVALIGPDLAEQSMLGDGGANSLGGAVGVGLAAAGGLTTSAAVLAGLVVATGVSEFVSFSAVIDRVGVLRWLDRLGRAA